MMLCLLKLEIVCCMFGRFDSCISSLFKYKSNEERCHEALLTDSQVQFYKDLIWVRGLGASNEVDIMHGHLRNIYIYNDY